MKSYYFILSTSILLAATSLAFADTEGVIQLSNKCIKAYPLVSGETDQNLLHLYMQLCDKKNKKDDVLKNQLSVQAAKRYQELGKNYKALQLVETLNAQNIQHSSLTDTQFLAGIAIANAALDYMRQEEMRYLSADLTYPPAKNLSQSIQNSLPAPDTSDAKAVVLKTSKKTTRKLAVTSSKKTTKKVTTQQVKTKKVEKIQSVESLNKSNANPFNAL